MISREEYDGLVENLARTYLAIARGIAGTEFIEGAGWRAVSNSFGHPICNFAICDDTEDVGAEELARLAISRRFFNVYSSHFGERGFNERALRRVGFAKLNTLAQMCSNSGGSAETGTIRVAETPGDRKRIADFMMVQFFSTQTPGVRERIANATVQARELQLYELLEENVRERPLGAVMLHRSERVLGLYNLCVRPAYRSRGLGASIVESAKLASAQESVILGLQCDPVLVSWYQSLTLDHVGDVDVYGLQKSSRL